MPKKVERFETDDGRLFSSEAEAAEYEVQLSVACVIPSRIGGVHLSMDHRLEIAQAVMRSFAVIKLAPPPNEVPMPLRLEPLPSPAVPKGHFMPRVGTGYQPATLLADPDPALSPRVRPVRLIIAGEGHHVSAGGRLYRFCEDAQADGWVNL